MSQPIDRKYEPQRHGLQCADHYDEDQQGHGRPPQQGHGPPPFLPGSAKEECNAGTNRVTRKMGSLEPIDSQRPFDVRGGGQQER